MVPTKKPVYICEIVINIALVNPFSSSVTNGTMFFPLTRYGICAAAAIFINSSWLFLDFFYEA